MPKAPARPLPRLIALAVASIALSACGGGGGGGGGTGPSGPQSIAGKVVDGHIAGATMTCLFGGAVQATTISDASGSYAFALPAGQTCDTVEARGGVDVGITPNDPADDIVRPAGVLRAPVPTGAASLANLVVSPLSTLMQSLVASGRTQADAANIVRTQLGLAPSVDPLAADPTTDLALYRAAGVVAQIIDQASAALAAAGGVTDDAGAQAIANAVTDALAASLAQGTTLAQLAAAPGTTTPTSPLVSIIAQATQAAKNNAAVGGLASVQPETLSLVAAPFVASAANAMHTAAGIQQAVDRAGTLAGNDTIATVIGSMPDILGTAPNAGQQQAILDALATAADAAAAGSTTAASVTVGGTTKNVPVPAGLTNFAKLQNDNLQLYGPSGPGTPATVAAFTGSPGVAIAQNLSEVGFVLEQSADGTQLAANREVPLAIEVRDATRTFQAIVDRVTLQQVGNVVHASVPPNARLTVYGKTANSETTVPFEVTLTTDELPIVATTAGEIRIDIDKLFGVIGNAAANGSALDQLAQNRVSNGTFTVTVVLGELRIAHATSNVDSTPRLATAYTVTLGAGSRAVSGRGLRGTVTVGS